VSFFKQSFFVCWCANLTGLKDDVVIGPGCHHLVG